MVLISPMTLFFFSFCYFFSSHSFLNHLISSFLFNMFTFLFHFFLDSFHSFSSLLHESLFSFYLINFLFNIFCMYLLFLDTAPIELYSLIKIICRIIVQQFDNNCNPSCNPAVLIRARRRRKNCLNLWGLWLNHKYFWSWTLWAVPAMSRASTQAQLHNS